jgi:hypothetical protein
MQRLKSSGLMPMSVPVNVFPVVVATITALSISAATSVKNFLCATDNFKPPFNLTKLHYNYISLIFPETQNLALTLFSCAFRYSEL